MRKVTMGLIGVVVLGAFVFLLSFGSEQTDEIKIINIKNMEIRSTAFEDKGLIPAKYTCDGDNINPPLEFIDVPSEAKSLVLLMEDPDVPKSLREDGMWDHWVVFNMAPDSGGIEEGRAPAGVVGVGTGEKNKNKYGGPCPPDREHRYFFKLFALDIQLDLDESATKADVEQVMEGHVLEKAQLMGRYDRG